MERELYFFSKVPSITTGYGSDERQVLLAKIRSSDPSWRAMVPPEVASLIKERGLFDYRPV